MIKNLLYLIDTNAINLIVTLFTMSVNRNGELILRFVQQLGELSSISELKNFFTDDAFIAVKENEYQDEYSSAFVKSTLPDEIPTTVVSGIVTGDKLELKPFGIKIFSNKVKRISQSNETAKDNEYVVMAALNYANIKSQNGSLVIVAGDSENCSFYEFHKTATSEEFKIENIPIEKEVLLNGIPKSNKKFYRTNFGDEFVTYEQFEFDHTWRKRMLNTLCDFYITGSELLIPRYDGGWEEKYIDGMSFPYMRFFKKIPTKNEWEEFLSIKENFPVSIGEIKKVC